MVTSKKYYISLFIITFIFIGCEKENKLDDDLLRVSYKSNYEDATNDAYLYLPRGYKKNSDKKWPVILFLHGNGERGNANDELDFVLMHGPMYEAWVQKKEIPFIIISPQLPMFGKDKENHYIQIRDITTVPQRIEKGTPERFPDFDTDYPMSGAIFSDTLKYTIPDLGWEERIDDVILILKTVLEEYNADSTRVYLTGLSYGGFGTWYIASKYPKLFSAIAPVVGWGHTELMKPIAKNQLPVWAFAGGRDLNVQTKYFFKGLNELEKLGHTKVRFTIHEDMGHDAWTRIYSGDDLYNWFLGNSKKLN